MLINIWNQSVFDQSLQQVLKLTPWTAIKLKKIGIITVRDMLFHLPYDCIERKIEPNFNNVSQDDCIVTTISIIKTPFRTFGKKPKILKYEAINGLGQKIEVLFFQLSPIIVKTFKQGSKITIKGKIIKASDKIEIIHPDIIFNKQEIKRIEPIYHLTQGISNDQLRRYALSCLSFIPTFEKWHNLAGELPSILNSLTNLHNPTDLFAAKNSVYIKRLALEEILINQFYLNSLRKTNKLNRPGINDIAHNYYKIVFSNLGFYPTISQSKVLEEIYLDQRSPNRSIRMLQGDVGSGKTFVALLSILNAVNNQKQCCLMSPTDILTVQHFEFFNRALKNTDLKIEMLTSKIKGKKRIQILEDLKQHKIHIIIGTHSLLQDNIVFADLGYIVIDEQHKFGVKQRSILLSKASMADLLLMSATPIPRSLSMVLYGDMDVSYIESKPKNNLPIITTLLSSKKIAYLIQSLHKIFDQNHQVYWICPLIQDSEKKSFTSVISRYDSLSANYKEDVGFLHGALPKEEKEEIMNSFKDNKIKLLVTTTVIEVGIDVPNATLIVIEDAQNFGLAQLHQLRGRVGRSHLQSYCILLYSDFSLSFNTRKRLEIMTQSQDGFKIAEKDLEIRGGGDIVGLRQSGHDLFTFVDLFEHKDLIIQAKNFIMNNVNLNPDKNIVSLFGKHFFDKEISV